MSSPTYSMMRCPWCGTALSQVTEAPGTADFQSSAECRHCGYRYEAKIDPQSGQPVAIITPGKGDRTFDAANPNLGPPVEVSAEYMQWICDQIADADELYAPQDFEDAPPTQGRWND